MVISIPSFAKTTRIALSFIKFRVNRRGTAEGMVKFGEFENCIIPQAVQVIGVTHVQSLALDTDNKPECFSRSILLTLKQ